MERLILTALLLSSTIAGIAQSFKGFDKNDYPGDDALPQLRRSFAWAGYWLNNPPGMSNNPWQGKRALLLKQGFGFALLFNGRDSQRLQESAPVDLGRADGQAAALSARRDGFNPNSVIFLDLEEGGRLTQKQRDYVRGWIAAVRMAGFRPGVYCSGIPVSDGPSQTITTAEDVLTLDTTHSLALWVAQDSCPPSPGCVVSANVSPAQSKTPDAAIWQFAQTPRRLQFAASCAQTYAPDGSCYAPGTQVFVDLNVSATPDPSQTK